MAPIKSLHKSLVDVSLGALAFLCAVDRTAIPVTHTLTVLIACSFTWVILAVSALASPGLIGGDTPTERFSELAPVIVLSIPMLWAALRRVQILLEIMDTLVGSLALVNTVLKQLRGVFDQRQSFLSSRSLHVVFHAVRQDDSLHPRSSRLSRRLHFAAQCATSSCQNSSFQNSASNPHITSVFGETLVFRWNSELLPLGANAGLTVPYHLYTDACVKEICSYGSNKGAEDAVTPALVTRSSGTVSPFAYFFRRLSFFLHRTALRTPFTATTGSIHLALDNVHSGWLLKPLTLRAQVLLFNRRGALRWPAIVVKYVQGTVNAIISSVDALIGHIGAFILVLLMEFAHPLRIRREHAMYILQSKGTVVADMIGRRETLKRIGQDRYMMCCSDTILLRTIMTLFRDRTDLAAKAILMLQVGSIRRQKPHGSKLKGISDRKLLLGDFGSISLPRFSQGDVYPMSLPSMIVEEVVAESAQMVILSHSVLEIARQRGYVPGAIQTGAGVRMFDGLCLAESDGLRKTRESICDEIYDDG